MVRLLSLRGEKWYDYHLFRGFKAALPDAGRFANSAIGGIYN
jgi:hypothetical protein